MILEIPGKPTLAIDHLVFDFNGTLAVDGEVSQGVQELIGQLAQQFDLIIATADTFGTAAQVAKEMGITLEVVKSAQDKVNLVRRLGERVAAIGNGANDAAMFRQAALSIAVLEREGCYTKSAQDATILAPSIESALQLFLHPKRLVATLRA